MGGTGRSARRAALADAVAQMVDGHPRFAGVVRIDVGDEPVVALARGWADRANGRPNTIDTPFMLASVTKGVTALVVVALVADGVLTLDTPARSILGPDLALIDDNVTVEHLLAHRSGIGDYLAEDTITSITDHLMPVPVHQLASAEAYLAVLDGHPQVDPPGTTFRYNNAGFVVLALIAERATGRTIVDLVGERVAAPAGAEGLALDRTDEPRPGAAVHYLHADGARTNVLHLPVQGLGDGGATGTVDDLHRLWRATVAGAVVPTAWVERMTTPSGRFPPGADRYGLGWWLAPTGPGLALEGYDAGISARTTHDAASGVTWTVLSNWSDGAWPVARELPKLLTEHQP